MSQVSGAQAPCTSPASGLPSVQWVGSAAPAHRATLHVTLRAGLFYTCRLGHLNTSCRLFSNVGLGFPPGLLGLQDTYISDCIYGREGRKEQGGEDPRSGRAIYREWVPRHSQTVEQLVSQAAPRVGRARAILEESERTRP